MNDQLNNMAIIILEGVIGGRNKEIIMGRE
jgi:hypothetical protein